MNDLNLSIKVDDLRMAHVTLLIDILATTAALGMTMIQLASRDEEELASNLAAWDRMKEKEMKAIKDELFASYGALDLGELIPHM